MVETRREVNWGEELAKLGRENVTRIPAGARDVTASIGQAEVNQESTFDYAEEIWKEFESETFGSPEARIEMAQRRVEARMRGETVVPY